MISNTTVTVWVKPEDEFLFLYHLNNISKLKNNYTWDAYKYSITKSKIHDYVQVNIDLGTYLIFFHSFNVNGGSWK